MITQQAKNQFCEVPIKLPIFLTSSSSRSNSPRTFASPSLVGLGIVAAMNTTTNPPDPSIPTRSNPIPISTACRQGGASQADETMAELSESYTCVISHAGKGSAEKRVYYVDGERTVSACVDHNVDVVMACDDRKWGLFCQSSPATPVVPTGFDFLKFCCGCKKSLEGIDIFMYRGDKAFCSTDCRYQQIVADEYREKIGTSSRSRKRFDCSVSPCSAPLHFAAGVAAA